MNAFKYSLLAATLGITCLAADLNRGKQLYLEGNLPQAVDVLREAVKESGDSAEANRLLGLALVEQEKVSEGEPYIKRAMELDSGPAGKIAMARLLIAQKQFDQAEEMLRDVPGDVEYVRGLLHLHRGRNAEAAKDFEAWLEKHGESAYAHYYAGVAYNKTRDTAKMLSHFEHFVRMQPDAPEARKVRAVLRTGR